MSEPNASFSAWGAEVTNVDPRLAAEMQENVNPYAVAGSLGLPTPAYRGFSTVQEFLDNPEAGAAPLIRQGVNNFYVGLRTAVVGWHNFRNGVDAMPWGDVLPFIEQHIPGDRRQAYNLRIAEFLRGICVVAEIDASGDIELSIAEGTLPPLTSGRVTPAFRASTANDDHKNPTRRLRYFGRDDTGKWSDKPLTPDETHPLNTAVRTAIWQGLGSIPVLDHTSDVRKPRLPGRYEFAVVRHHSYQTAIFADASPYSRGSRLAAGSPRDVPALTDRALEIAYQSVRTEG